MAKRYDSKRLFDKRSKKAHKEMRDKRRNKANRHPMPAMA